MPTMEATPVSECTEGPVLSFINKRLRTLRKKNNRILQMEESLSQGKSLNKEQEEFLHSKPHVTAAIDELEKLRVPLAAAVAEEINVAVQRHQQLSSASAPTATVSEKEQDVVIEDLLNLLYFGTMFDVKTESDFTSTLLTRTHERGCCLTYDYVTDDESADLLSEKDLDSISMLSSLLVSRRVDSSFSHKDALQRCVLNAKQWLLHSDHPIDSDPNFTYCGLRAKLNKIMASDYFTRTPEMKVTVEMAAAAAGNYASFQVPVHESMVPVSVPANLESLGEQCQLQKVEDASNFHGSETHDNQSSPVEESQNVGGFDLENSTDAPSQSDIIEQAAAESQNQREHHYAQRGNYRNSQRGGRGGGGGRRGYYANGRGSRGSSRGVGGSYQNGRNEFYDHPGGNYYSRNYYTNNRARGGRGSGGGGGGGGGNFYNNHGSSGAHATNAPAES